MSASKLVRNGHAYHVNADTLRRVLDQRDCLLAALRALQTAVLDGNWTWIDTEMERARAAIEEVQS